jgi:hypothetical protein
MSDAKSTIGLLCKAGGSPAPSDHRRASYRARVVEAGPGEYTASISLVPDGADIIGAGGLGSGIMDVVEELLLQLVRGDQQ